MKSSEFTVADALWWDRKMLIADITKANLRGSPWFAKWALKALDDPLMPYYCDAPLLAVTEYLHDKHCEIDGPFKIVMTVKTIDGDKRVYTVQIGEMNFATKDFQDVLDEIGRPTALKLVREAAKELKFEEVISVSAYVEEVEEQ